MIQVMKKAKSGHLTELAFIRAFWFGKLEFEAVYLQCNNTRLYGKNNKAVFLLLFEQFTFGG